ncbi:MAG: CoA transferase subunit A [Anaerolineae bacterium]|jgi:glutaconate CoA-transferase subunit A|nr:CoA transferase subunit A [Anaerolineae bacterium]
MTHWIDLKSSADCIQDGMTIAIGGMTLYRRPVAWTQALLRRASRPRDLTLLAFTAGYECDLLVGAGVIRTIRSCYFGLEAFGLAPMFTHKAAHGELRILEETETSLVLGLRAAISGVPFMPSQAWIGTDLPRLRPDVQTVTDPYTGQTLTAFPAIPVDVAVIHALAADSAGNVLINTNLGIDPELVYAADRVIVTVERVVEKLEKSVDGLLIPGAGVDMIAIAPNGAAPTSCYPDYPLRGSILLDYIEACNRGDFEKYLIDFLDEPR